MMKHCSKTKYLIILFLFAAVALLAIGSSAWNIHLRVDQSPETAFQFTTDFVDENDNSVPYLNQYITYGATESVSAIYKEKAYPTYTYGGNTYVPTPAVSSTLTDNSFNSAPARDFPQEIMDCFVYTYVCIAKPLVNAEGWEDCEIDLGNTAPFDAGVYTCAVSNSHETYGNFIGQTAVTYIIQPKNATLYIEENTSVYGDELSEITAIDTDGHLCIGDEHLASALGNYSIDSKENDPEIAAAEDIRLYAGAYDINGTDNSANYNLLFIKNTYTVTPRPISVRPDDKFSYYGDEILTLTASVTIGDLAYEDNLYALVSLSTQATATADATDYEISPSLVTSHISSSYEITFEAGVYTIEKAPLTIVAEDKNITYGDELPTLTPSYQGFKNGETEAILSTSPSFTCAYEKGLEKGSVGNYSITPILEDQLNYYIIPIDGTLAVTRKPLCLSLDDKATTYGENAPLYTYSATGFFDTETTETYQLDLTSHFEGAYTVGDGFKAEGYAISWLSDSAFFEEILTNYSITLENGILTVEKRALTVKIHSKTSVYGEDIVPLSSEITSGTVYGEDIPYSIYSDINEKASADNYDILGNVENDNYAITFLNGVYNVSQREVTLSWENLSFTYDSTVKTPTATAGNVLAGDSVTVTVSGGQSMAGSHIATASALDNANYCLPQEPTVSFSVSSVTLTVTLDNAESVYGNPIATLNATVTAGVIFGNDIPYSLTTEATVGSGIGTYPISGVTANPSYEITFINAVYTITVRYITVTINNASSYYGEEISTLSAAVTVGSAYNGEIPYTLSTTATSSSSVGTYPISGQSINGNYDITFTEGVYTVEKAPITFIADSLTVSYGDPIPSYTYSDTAPEGISVNLNCAYVQTVEGGAIGNYDIIISAEDTTGNYEITTVNGVLTVKQAKLTVTAANASITYGDAAPTYIATVEGTVYGDVFTPSATCSYVAGSPAQSYDIIPSVVATDNYETVTVNGVLTVEQKEIIITWYGENGSSSDFVWVYDKTLHCPTATWENVIEGDDITVVISGDQTNAGVGYFATATISGEDASNYFIAESNASQGYQITRCPTVKPTANGDVSFVYNGASQYNTILTTGIDNYDSEKMSIDSFVAADAQAHNFAFTPTSNYMWDDGTITEAIVQITIAKVKVRVMSNLLDCSYNNYTTGVPLSFLTNNLMATTTCSGALSTSLTYDDGVNVSTLTSTTKITVGNTYKITYSLASTKNMEFAGNNYCYLKYKTIYVGSDYYTIEDAITETTGNIVLTGGNQFTTSLTKIDCYGTKDFTIANGRTLFVPHISGVKYNGNDTEGEVYSLSQDDPETTSHTNSVYSVLMIPAGINLTINGAMGVGGTMFPDGVIYEHGVVMNEGTITVNKALHSYGFIKSATGNGSVIINPGAQVREVFAIYNYKGGRNTYGITEIFPFDAFSLHNISCSTTIYSGAIYSLKFYEIISASILGTRNVLKDIVLIGAGGIFELTEGYIIKRAENAKATPNDPNLTTVTGSNQVVGQRDKIIVCGNAIDNSITVEESFMGMGIKIVTSKTYPLPFPYIDIEIGTDTIDSTINLTNVSYTMMPGCYIKVNEGSTLNIGSGVVIYSYSYAQAVTDFTKPKYVYTYSGSEQSNAKNYGFINFCVDKTDSAIQVDGTMNVAGSIGGVISTTRSDARINLTGNVSATVKTLATLSYSSSETKSPATYTSSTINAKGKIDGSTVRNFEAQSYISVGTGTSAYWTPAASFSSYTLNLHTYGNVVDSTTRYYSGTAPTLQVADFGTPTKEYYSFDGWYTDQTYSNAFTSQTVSDGMTIDVYAKWSLISYNVTYNLYSDVLGGTMHDPSMNNSGSSASYSAESALVLKAPSATGANGAMLFDGWYLYNSQDKTYIKVDIGTVGTAGTAYNGYILGSSLTHFTLYGVLKDVAKYNLTYVAQTDKTSTQWITAHTATVLDGSTISTFFDITENYNYDPSFPYYFTDEWYLNEALTVKITSSTVINADMATDGVIKLYAKRLNKSQIVVTYINYTGATATTTDFYVTAGGQATVTLPAAPSRSGYVFKGWSIGSSIADNTLSLPSTLSMANAQVAISADTTVYGVWYQAFTATVTQNNATVSGVSNNQTLEYGQQLTISISFSQTNDITYTITGCSSTRGGTAADIKGTAALSNKTVYVAGNVTVNASSSSCLAAGSMIMMADGTEKKVEDITPEDYLLVFNHETGKFESAKVMFVDSDGWRTWRVLNLRFADGTIVRIIYEHGFFDLTLNTYVYIDEFNAQNYIGHEFATTERGNNGYNTGKTTLVDWYVTEEYTGCYSPTTVYHLNLIVDGMLSMPGGIKGMFNFFDYDPETLAYDRQAMENDIEAYGLLSYDFFAEYMSYEVYCLFPARYIGISLGKGLMTVEDLEYLIERYIVGLDLESTVPSTAPPSG